jgi:hypothetical protein
LRSAEFLDDFPGFTKWPQQIALSVEFEVIRVQHRTLSAEHGAIRGKHEKSSVERRVIRVQSRAVSVEGGAIRGKHRRPGAENGKRSERSERKLSRT